MDGSLNLPTDRLEQPPTSRGHRQSRPSIELWALRLSSGQPKMIIRLHNFEHFMREADTYWPRPAVAGRTQVTRVLRNVDKMFSINASVLTALRRDKSLVAAAQPMGVSASQWGRNFTVDRRLFKLLVILPLFSVDQY